MHLCPLDFDLLHNYQNDCITTTEKLAVEIVTNYQRLQHVRIRARLI